jgi:predicted PurR-regulated permease PerM
VTPEDEQERFDQLTRRRSRRFILALLLLLLAIATWVAWPFRGAVVLAVFLGYVLRPAYTKLLGAVRWRPVAAGIVLFLVAAALVTPLFLIGREVVEEAGAVRASLDDPAGLEGQAIDLLGRFGLDEDGARSRIHDTADALAAALQGLLLDVIGAAPDLLLGIIVFFLLLYYVLVDGARLVEAFRHHVPLPADRRERLLRQTGDRVRAILLGSFFVYILQGVAAGVAWWFFGYPAPVFWAFVMMFLAILPFLGPQLVTVPAGILRIMQGDLFAGVGLIVWSITVVSLIDDFVRPWVIGKRSGVHPALILLGTLGGLEVFGLAGFVLGPLLLGLVGPVLENWSESSPKPPEGSPIHDENAMDSDSASPDAADCSRGA